MAEGDVNASERLDSWKRPTDAPAIPQGFFARTENSQFVVIDAQGNKTWFVDTTAGAVTVPLLEPKAAFGLRQTVKRLTGGGNGITVTTPTGTIDGAANHSVALQYQSYNYTSDGTNYWIW